MTEPIEMQGDDVPYGTPLIGCMMLLLSFVVGSVVGLLIGCMML